MNSKIVGRIAQLDAKALDHETQSLLIEQLSKVFQFTGQKFFACLEPELKCLVQLLIYYETLIKKKQSVGQRLLQVRYSQRSEANLKWYTLFLVMTSWTKTRLPSLLTKIETIPVQEVLLKYFNIVEVSLKMAEILNFLVFLHQGKYPSLLERFFNLRHTYIPRKTERQILYGFFTHELIWNGFADVLAYILPLVNIQKFHNLIRHVLPSSSYESSSSVLQTNPIVGSNTKCAICNKLPILPHLYGCQHILCYYCIHSSCANDKAYKCPLCGGKPTSFSNIHPYIIT